MKRNLYQKNVEYTVTANWNGDTGGTVEANGFKISFDTPQEYNGKGTAPCPDQLFLASITGCLMNTLLNFKNRMEIEAQNIIITAELSLELKDKAYQITGIKSEIKLQATEDTYEELRRCAEWATEYCHITRSIETVIPLQFNIKKIEEYLD
jgi:organic hydroperoxide reductase OsmC/OhrA